MSDKRILYVSQEIMPYMPKTELSEMGRELPQMMHRNHYEVRTFMPKYGSINERRNQLHEVIRLSGVNIIIDNEDHPLIIKVASLQPTRIQVYFVDNDDYFQKSAQDEDPVGSNRKDNDERAIFYARGVMETAKKLRWEPKIVHFSGLISALAPLYLRNLYHTDPVFHKSKSVYSVVPGDFTAELDPRIYEKLIADNINPENLAEFVEETPTAKTLHKIAISNSDGVIFHEPYVDAELVEYVQKKGIPYSIVTLNDIQDNLLLDFYNKLTDE
ncbi:MAG: glycogen/starch synthase [Clostridium sp.]|nr:glycogen/starch synthase [Prevotella sp.]MCM1429629.1 glycogen/starch synthase [Clostridium sp.]MCM1474687.1 glycogen/starch synthase [Muribaculaceae bacterium]